MSLFDLLVVGIVILSALLASVRGFTREVLAIASWIAAGAAAYALHPYVLNYITPHIDNKQIALAASIAVVFLVVLVAVTLVTVRISDIILDSRIGALDRSLGFLFGAVRGLLIAAIAFIFFDKLVGEKQYPDWVKTARLRPVLKDTGDAILSLIPADPEMLERLKNRAKNGPDAGSTGPVPAAPAPSVAPTTPAAPAANTLPAPAANGKATPKLP